MTDNTVHGLTSTKPACAVEMLLVWRGLRRSGEVEVDRWNSLVEMKILDLKTVIPANEFFG